MSLGRGRGGGRRGTGAGGASRERASANAGRPSDEPWGGDRAPPPPVLQLGGAVPARAAARARGERPAAAAAAAAAATEATVEPGGGACQSPMVSNEEGTSRWRPVSRDLWRGGGPVEGVGTGWGGRVRSGHVGFEAGYDDDVPTDEFSQVSHSPHRPLHQRTAASVPPSSQSSAHKNATCGRAEAGVGGSGADGPFPPEHRQRRRVVRMRPEKTSRPPARPTPASPRPVRCLSYLCA